MTKFLVVLVLALSASTALAQVSSMQLTQPTLTEDKQRRLFFNSTTDPANKLSINTVTGSSRVDNAATLSLRGDVSGFPFLATIPAPGSSIFITALKACGMNMPHIHPRATEQYLIISGTMQTGLAEESSGLPNITSTLTAGQSFVVPQGLLHYQINRGCTPLVFLQVFDNIDPGTVNVINALASLSRVDAQSIAAATGNTTLTASPLGTNNIDPTCLAACGLTSSGGGLNGLSSELQMLMGVSSMAPGMAPMSSAASSG